MATEPNAEALTKLWENTRVPPPEKVQQVDKGKFTADAVGHADVTDMLLEHDILWTWRPMTPEETPSGGPALERDDKGRPAGLWIWLTVFDMTRPGYGSVDPTKNEAVKELIGDAIRNAAMRFGVALTLWSKTERQTPPAPEPKKRAAARKPAGEGTPAPPPPPGPDLGQRQAELFSKVKSLSPEEIETLKGMMAEEKIPLDFSAHTAEQVDRVEAILVEHFNAPF